MGKDKITYYSKADPNIRSYVRIDSSLTIADLIKVATKETHINYTHAWVDGSGISLADTISDYTGANAVLILTEGEVLSQDEINEIYSSYKDDLGSPPKLVPLPSSSAGSSKPSTAPLTPSASKPPGASRPPGPAKPPGISRPPGGGAGAGSGAAAGGPPGPKVGIPKPLDSPGSASLGPQKVIDFTGDQNIFNQTISGFQLSDLSISLRNENRPETSDKSKLRLFCTATPELLLEGFEFVPNFNWTPSDCSSFLLKEIRNDVKIQHPQLLLYLPGGIKFTHGTLGDFFNDARMKMGCQRVLYGVLTRTVKDEILDYNFPELCDVRNAERKLLISPICDSSDKGVADMACLLGYLNHDGIKGDLLIKTLAAVTHFPPLITEMSRIIERSEVTGRTIVTVMGTLFCYFRYMLPTNVALDKVYEYGLRCCNIITHIGLVPDNLPLITINIVPSSQDPAMKMFIKLKQPDQFFLWRGDTGENFQYQNLAKPEAQAIELANNTIASFRPILPLSIRNATGCSIVAGKDHTYLYLMQSCSKEISRQNYVDIINPLTGITESKDLEIFAKEQGITESTGKTENLIDPDRVKQIINVCFDESESMIGNIDGERVFPSSTPTEPLRVTIAKQYLTTFASRTYGYRIPCIQGLISFNQLITKRCPLCPLIPDFEEKGMKDIEPNWQTNLWDAILTACNDLIAFNIDSNGKKVYPNATSRILVISDGDDVSSTAKPADVVKKLIENKIIVDSVIISSEIDKCKMLCALCHITGGYSFCPQTISEGLALFEKSAFLNVDERNRSYSAAIIDGDRQTTPSKLKPGGIDDIFMGKAEKCAKFDKDIVNKDISSACLVTRLTKPRHVIFKNKDTVIPVPRQRRILRELHAAAEVSDKNNIERYDPDLMIFTYQSNLDRWKVFIRGSVNTPYANKWWQILVTFPELYPVEAPIFRFITVPYHINVSSEGRICLNTIERGYISSKHVVDILQEIKEIFLLPCEETPIQTEIYLMYKNNHQEYERLARESTEKNAIGTAEECLKPLFILDESPAEFEIQLSRDKVPPYMMSQISGRAMKNVVRASSGVDYDRDELRQLLSSSKTPICVITGKILTDRIEDI